MAMLSFTSVDGRWGKAIEVPGMTALNKGGYAGVQSVSCVTVGNCAVGGYDVGDLGHYRAFVVNEVKMRWGIAHEVPGSAVLNAGGRASAFSVSCGSAGNCAVVGQHIDSANHAQVYLVAEVRGRWHDPKQVPGTESLTSFQ